jgi:hypothetical protein
MFCPFLPFGSTWPLLPPQVPATSLITSENSPITTTPARKRRPDQHRELSSWYATLRGSGSSCRLSSPSPLSSPPRLSPAGNGQTRCLVIFRNSRALPSGSFFASSHQHARRRSAELRPLLHGARRMRTKSRGWAVRRIHGHGRRPRRIFSPCVPLAPSDRWS